MPVVDGAHLHLDGPSLVLEPRLAKTGHAQQQGRPRSVDRGSAASKDAPVEPAHRPAGLGRSDAGHSHGGARLRLAGVGWPSQGFLRVPCRESPGSSSWRAWPGPRPTDAGASAGNGEPDGRGLARRPGAGRPWLAFPLRRASPWSEVGGSEPQPEAVRRLVRTTRSMAMRIQIEAVTTVILVNMSPALVPNALEPPTPPKAPASPPPLPRWIRIRQIRKSEVRTISVLKMAVRCPRVESFDSDRSDPIRRSRADDRPARPGDHWRAERPEVI